MEQRSKTLEDYVAGLYEDMRERVFRYLLLLDIPPDEARELCQETFMRLYARRRGRRFEPSPIPCARRCRTTLRAPDREVLDQERRRRMRGAVQGHSPRQRQCLHLRAEGLRHREIAQVLGIGGSTVGASLQAPHNQSPIRRKMGPIPISLMTLSRLGSALLLLPWDH
ncbi:MAG: sigma-70 family RNA polymerase sigma factor [Acidobacteria bacterium]|nr:sigma-70 family RNA polymerase sigma factor [Acidobacteriota bacterium]